MERVCGNCRLCCKLPGVYSLPTDEVQIEKPRGQWCTHCAKGIGCTVYENRPQPCRNFNCLWLVHPEMAEELRPDRIHVVMYGLTEEDKQETGAIAVIMEDPDYYRHQESLNKQRLKPAIDLIRSQGKVLIVNGSKKVRK